MTDGIHQLADLDDDTALWLLMPDLNTPLIASSLNETPHVLASSSKSSGIVLAMSPRGSLPLPWLTLPL